MLNEKHHMKRERERVELPNLKKQKMRFNRLAIT